MNTENQDQEVMTLGKARCHVSFNPAQNQQIAKLKLMCADLIDECTPLMCDDPEVNRCLSIAMTNIETAQMYMVKAVAKTL